MNRAIILLVFGCLMIAKPAQAFYNQSTGRWLSRDPIGEKDSSNLYGFTRNRPVVKIDRLGLEELGPSDFTSICNMSERLQDEIGKLPSGSLKLRFLKTQQCILDKLCHSTCCLSPPNGDWLKKVVADFMGPLFAALSGNPNESWSDTFGSIDKVQGMVDAKVGNGDNSSGAGAADVIIEWPSGLSSARAMALTHVDQDLRKSLEKNGAGSKLDWKCIGRQVSDCEKKFFNGFERAGSFLLGGLFPSFDISQYRDSMRDEVQRGTIH